MIVHNVRTGRQESKQTLRRDHKKIFVGCAEPDLRYRDLLIYGKHRWELYSNPTIEFSSFDCEGLGLNQCKLMVEQIMREIDGVMIIVSTHTSTDPLALYQIDCSIANDIPVVGVDVRFKFEGDMPQNLAGKMIKFGWEWFVQFFNRL